MPSTPIFLGAYWPSRKEDRYACGTRVSIFLTAIGSSVPPLKTWMLTGKTMQDAQQRIELTPDGIACVLKTNKRDTTGEAISELGYGASLWNGKNTSFLATLGSVAVYTGNSAVLSFGEDEPLAAHEWRFIIEQAVAAFDPDSAVVTSHDYISRHGGGQPSNAGGWFTYKRSGAVVEYLFP